MGGRRLAAKPQLLAWQWRVSLSRCQAEVSVGCNLAGGGLVGELGCKGRALESDLASFWLYFLPWDPGRLVPLSEP